MNPFAFLVLPASFAMCVDMYPACALQCTQILKKMDDARGPPPTGVRGDPSLEALGTVSAAAVPIGRVSQDDGWW